MLQVTHVLLYCSIIVVMIGHSSICKNQLHVYCYNVVVLLLFAVKYMC